MRKGFILLVLLSFAEIAVACEICGCGNNNFQIGLLPNFRKGFIGMRYTTSHFNSSLKNDPTQYSNDYYKSVELWGGYQFKKIQLMTFIPYFSSRKVSDDGATNFNGFGDLILLANYRLLNKASVSENLSRTIHQEIWIGGGVKLPTGANHLDVNQPNFNVGDFNSQPGTGSVDFLFNVTYNLLWNNSGIVTNVTYRANTENNQHYQFGNRTYLTTSYFYTLNIKQVKLKPIGGLNYVQNKANTYLGDKVSDSDGYTLNGLLGVNILWRKFGLMANTFVPLEQDMYDHQTKLQNRSTIGLTYSF